MRVFRRDRLVAKVEAQTVLARLADDAREQHGGGQKVHVRQLLAVAEIPQHARAGTALHVGALGVNRKGRRAAGDDVGHRQLSRLQVRAQCLDSRPLALALLRALSQIHHVVMAVVAVQARRPQPRRASDEPVKLHRLRPRHDAGAVHAHVHVEVKFQRAPRCREGRAQRANRARVIRHGGELSVRKLLREREHSAHVWPDRLIRQQGVRRAAARDHLRLGDGGALELRDAQLELEPDDVGHLVRLHVRPQPRRSARHGDHPPHVLRHAVGINEQRGRRHFGDIGDAIPVRIHGRRFE